MAYYKFDGSLAAATSTAVLNYYGTSVQDTYQGTADAETFWGGQGDVMYGGAGDDTYYVLATTDQVHEQAGAGVDRIVSWGSIALTQFQNIENVAVGGDDRYAVGDAVDNIVEGMEGRQQIYGGGGQDVLIGGAGADVFIVYKGEGNDVIQDFSVTEDKIRLKAGFTSFDQLQSHMSQVGSDVLIDMGGGDGVMLRGVQLDQLTASNFQLQLDTSNLGALTFGDEFNGPVSFWDAVDAPNGTWRTDYGYQGSNGVGSYTLTGNGELQIYTSPYFRDHKGDFAESPFVVNDDGTMSIWAKPSSNPEIFGYNYISGALTTQPTFAQTYGYFEIRADVPNAAGAWPAFWLVPNDGSWPPELDVMETLSGDPNVAWTTAHSSNDGHTASGQANYFPDSADGMHTYGALWTPTEIVYYVDQVEVFRTATPSDMNKPMHLIVNMALGGWAGDVDASAMPAEFKIDYVHAYALGDPNAPSQSGSGAGSTPNPPAGSGGSTTAPPADDSGSTTTPPAGTGETSVSTSAANYVMAADTLNVTLTGAHQTVTGNSLNNVITSNNNINVLDGGAGDDTLVAGRDGDTLTGGAGHDVFAYPELPWNGTHITDFTVGEDKVDIGGALAKLGYAGSDPIADGWLKIDSDGAGAARIWIDPDGKGSAYAGWLVATLDNVQASSLTYSAGAISGVAGAPPATDPGPGLIDMVYINDQVYQMPENVAGATLLGSRQVVTAREADSTIVSNNNINTLIGGAGDDTLVSGRDGDTLTGGAGHDHFVYPELPWNGTHITDFAVGEDAIDIGGALAKLGYVGSNPVADGWLKIDSDAAGSARVWIDPDGKGSAYGDWLLATVDHVSASSLTYSDGVISGAAAAPVPVPTTPMVWTADQVYQLSSDVAGATLTGSRQTVIGNAADNTLVSNNNINTLDGGAGDDTLVAGRDGDTLTGGVGHDHFVFPELPWNGAHITDFKVGEDVLDISGALAKLGYAGSDPVADGWVKIDSDAAGDARLWIDPDGHGATYGDWLLVTMTGVHATDLHAQTDWVFG